MTISKVWGALCVAVVLACSGCATSAPNVVSAGELANSVGIEDYRLGPADKVRLIVYGEPDLSGEFALSATGQMSVPLLGEVDANGKTVDELRDAIVLGLSEGFVNDAKVAAEVVTFRPYYILGEVGKPGEYPYSAGMSVLKAVAAAQGFTYRAKKNAVYIKRSDADEEVLVKLTQDITIYPGDIVRVGERFF